LSAHGQSQWPTAGQNLNNSRSQPAEHSISPANVKNLSAKWVFTTTNDVSATPTVVGDAVYFPDWGGNLYAVNKESGSLIWSHKISDYDNIQGAFSRVSPAVDVENDQLIIGDNPHGLSGAAGVKRVDPSVLRDILDPNKPGGARVIAVDRATGTLRWITQVDSQPAAIITGSPVVFNGVVYQGVSSGEEGLASSFSYPCCTSRGSVVALDAKTGKMLWQTFTVPPNGGLPGGYSGGAVWQPPAIDPTRGSLFIGTGDNYSVPADVEACQIKNPKSQCTAADDYFDTALALDLKTGLVKWAKGLQTVDTFTGACLEPPYPNVNCPVPSSPDLDLGGSGPNLVGGIVGFGQKSGIYRALNPDNGNILWATRVGPSSFEGEMEWGTATDGTRIYTAVSDMYNKTKLVADFISAENVGANEHYEFAFGLAVALLLQLSTIEQIENALATRFSPPWFFRRCRYSLAMSGFRCSSAMHRSFLARSSPEPPLTANSDRHCPLASRTAYTTTSHRA